MTSMWGDWLPKMVAEMNAADPTAVEKDILCQAKEIKEAHNQRIEAVRQKYAGA